MKRLADAIAVLEDLRNLGEARRYAELERRLLDFEPEDLLAEPELGYRLLISWLHLRRTSRALPLAKKLLEVLEKHRNVELYGRVRYLRAIFLGRAGKLKLAEEELLRTVASLADVSRFSASVNNSLGVVYSQKGEWDLALSQLQRSLVMYRQLGDNLGVAAASHNLGVTTRYLGHCEIADRWFHAAASYYTAEGILEEKIMLDSERALAILGLGDARLADHMARRALEQCRATGNLEMLGDMLRVVGTVLREARKTDEARALLFEAYRHARVNRKRHLLGELHLELGRLAASERNNGQAHIHFGRAISHFNALGATGFSDLVSSHARQIA